MITTAHAHKSGVIFHIFPRAFKKKKIKALRPKMTKIASRGGGPALTQPMIVFCTLYFEPHFPNSLASSLHSIYGILLLITISDHDFILYSSAILDTMSTIQHEPALCSMALLLLHSNSFVWVWDTAYNTGDEDELLSYFLQRFFFFHVKSVQWRLGVRTNLYNN